VPNFISDEVRDSGLQTGLPFDETENSEPKTFQSSPAAAFHFYALIHILIMKIISWNVNGIRSAAKKGFITWLNRESPEILCIQETKAGAHDVPPELRSPEGYFSMWHSGDKPGYAGTAIFSKEEPQSWKSQFDVPEFHEHGRVIQADFEDFTLLNIYFPNGGTRADGTEMLSYKLRFYDELMSYCDGLRKPIIICGDFNIAHEEIDIARPKENENSIGFLPIERAKFSELLSHGYKDAFREFHPTEVKYSWWSFRTRARERNVGWRLDYFITSKDLKIKASDIITEVQGSDHCPVFLEL
jgi:exodeoxyribonuclease III